MCQFKAVAGCAATWDPTVWGPPKRLIVFQIFMSNPFHNVNSYIALSAFSVQVYAQVAMRRGWCGWDGGLASGAAATGSRVQGAAK